MADIEIVVSVNEKMIVSGEIDVGLRSQRR